MIDAFQVKFDSICQEGASHASQKNNGTLNFKSSCKASKTFVEPLDHARAAQIKPAPKCDLRVGHRERIQHMICV